MRIFQVPRFDVLVISLALGSFTLSIPQAHAACNNPPVIPPSYNGERGSIDSPFLIPGEHSGKKARMRKIGSGTIADGDIVSIVYLGAPGSNATPTVRVLAAKCSDVDLSNCPTVAQCDQMAPTIVAGASAEFAVTEFKFETDARFGKVSRTGPVRLAVTTTAVSPCDFIAQAATCPTGSTNPDVHACIEKLTVSSPPTDDEIDSVTALPPSNNFSRICSGGGCTGGGEDLLLAVDARGDLLVPMDWSKVLKKKNDASKDCEQDDQATDPFNGPPCEHRNVSAVTTLPRTTSSPDPIQIPVGQRRAYLQTFNEYGKNFPGGPGFDADTADTKELALYGDIDKPHSVLRVRRCKASDLECKTNNPVFQVGARVDDGGALVIPREKNGKGYCGGDVNGAKCKLPDPCAGDVACIGVNGEDKGVHLTSEGEPATAESPPPPPPAPENVGEPQAEPVASPPPVGGREFADGPLPYWIAVIAVLGVAWIFVRKRGI